MGKYLAAALMLLAAASPTAPPTAREQLATLRQQAKSANQSGDRQAYLQTVLRIQALLHDSPAAVEATARAYAAIGDSANALHALNTFADQGQTDDRLLNPSESTFAALHNLPEYKSILDHLARNNTPVSRATEAFLLPDPNLVAEDITYDPQSKSFLITSILQKKIIRVTLDGRATNFAQSPDHWPMLAIKADPARNLLWATEVALDGFTAAPRPDWGRSAILSFNLKTGELLNRIEGPARSALGDLAITREGTPIVSDNLNGSIYKLVAKHLDPINTTDFISPQTPAMLPDGEHAFVPDYLRGIGILNLKDGKVIWLNQNGKTALSGIDGLYLAKGSILITQNGTTPERVIRLQLDSTLTQVVSEDVIERATATLGDPTHGVIVGGYFYYIANSGWSELDAHGDVNPGSKLTPAHIMRFAL